MTQTPWAILLCKFNDNDSEPFPRQFYENLFTGSGAGTHNMVDYFRDVSHGNLDLSGSAVFGWFTLDKKRADYVGSGANQEGRDALIEWARQKASENQVNLGAYFNTVVCMNVPTDLFGGGNGVVCDNGVEPRSGVSSMSPSILGQEMGHGYGLSHSRIAGSTADYMDSWDVMSTLSAYMTPHPVYTQTDNQGRRIIWMGPTLNAANMADRGWLDESRVWNSGGEEFSGSIQLRPLVRRDLPGYLAARIGDYLVEFRVKESWDAGIPAAAVLVHDFSDGHSYLYSNAKGGQSLAAGDSFQRGNPDNPLDLSAGMKIEVTQISAAAYTATLQVMIRHDRRPHVGPGIVFGGVLTDGGGWIILNGKIHRVPPRSPVMRIVEHAATLVASSSAASVRARDAMREDALSAIADHAWAELSALRSYRQPSSVALDRSLEAGSAYGSSVGTG